MKAKLDELPDISETLQFDQPSGKRRNLKRWGITAISSLAVIVIAVTLWKVLSPPPAPQYKTQKANRGDLTVIVTATGTLQPTNKVEVGSELSGIIKTVETDYNARVKVGQVLAKLDTSKLEAQVTQSKASLESARSKVLQARATVNETRSKLAQFRKVKELSNNKVPSQTEIDNAEAALERALADEASAKAAVSQAQATLDANRTDLSKAVIRSPIQGIVLSRAVEPGQTVAASFTTPVLFTLAEDLTKMELHVNVDEADVGQIHEGQKATFSVAAYPNRTFEARIIQARYGSSTTSGVVTYETVLKVDNTDLVLRPGMTATADIVVKKIQNALLIPSAALRFTPPAQTQQDEKKPSSGLVGAILPRPPASKAQQKTEPVAKHERHVWILNDGRLSRVAVTVGSSNGGMTEVIAGELPPGTEVVVDTVSAAK